MRPHHTKDKGDVGVAHAIADLADQGFVVLTALREHAPFDLVAYRHGTFARVRVKHRTLASNGAIKVNFVSSWSDSRGTNHRPIDNKRSTSFASTALTPVLVTTSTRRPLGSPCL